MAVLKYSLLRLGVFALVFFGCLYLNLGRFTVIFAAVVGLAVSWAVGYLFFNTLRMTAGEQLAGSLSRRRRSAAEEQDNAAEDELAEEFHSQELGEDAEGFEEPHRPGRPHSTGDRLSPEVSGERNRRQGPG